MRLKTIIFGLTGAILVLAIDFAPLGLGWEKKKFPGSSHYGDAFSALGIVLFMAYHKRNKGQTPSRFLLHNLICKIAPVVALI